ncbi:MAG: hypothetical protein K2K16_12335 [Ruminococcus sp.]|nr:hypothetical protein [Ruminococcus sp.]MDE6672961.1 hypothetical protein [Ruminococcus sp.]
MIKGVNKKIIEVNHPESIYFEKAVFYLRPEVRELPAEVTREEAEKYISMITPELRRKKRLKIIPAVTAVALIAVLIIILTVI